MVVVGAGLAGLSCASELVRRGRGVTVLDASDGVGGRVRSDRVDGFVLDRGFQVLLTAYPEVQQQLDLPALRLNAFRPGALVRHDGGFHRVSASAAGRTGVDLTEAVRAQFRRWFGRVVESWRHLRTDDIPRALPDQSPPLRPKQSVRLANGVYVCGDHRDTGSVQGALFSGRRTAALVASGS